MRQLVFLVIAALSAFNCGRSGARAATPTAHAFISTALMTTAADADMAIMATRQARLPETRELGAAMYRTSASMRADLTRIALHRGLPLPKGVEEKKAERYQKVIDECNDFIDRFPQSPYTRDVEGFLTQSQNNLKSLHNEQTKTAA